MLRLTARVLFPFVLVLSCSSLLCRSFLIAADQAGSAAAVDPDHATKRKLGLEVFKTDVRVILKDKCVTCHTTPGTQTTQAFAPVVFDRHARENIATWDNVQR